MKSDPARHVHPERDELSPPPDIGNRELSEAPTSCTNRNSVEPLEAHATMAAPARQSGDVATSSRT
jgi:hypothetical protein